MDWSGPLGSPLPRHIVDAVLAMTHISWTQACGSPFSVVSAIQDRPVLVLAHRSIGGDITCDHHNAGHIRELVMRCPQTPRKPMSRQAR